MRHVGPPGGGGLRWREPRIVDCLANRVWDQTTRLATEIAAAVTRVTGVPSVQVTVVIQPGPARFALESGRVLPEPGHEDAWIAQGSD
jgi:hypothetical protein